MRMPVPVPAIGRRGALTSVDARRLGGTTCAIARLPAATASAGTTAVPGLSRVDGEGIMIK